MFKQAISAVTSSVVGAAKRTIDEYKPTNAIAEGGAFERIAQQGIVNMSYRSPVMADMANTMLKSFQVEIARKASVRAHVKSSGADGLREAVQAGMEKDASPKKVDALMESILSKMQATLDKSGTEEAKKTDLFSKYGKYFETFQAGRKANTETQTPEQTPGVPIGSGSGSGSGVDGVSQTLLGKIESNTLRTVNALEVSASRANLSGGGGGSVSGSGSKSSPFIDPLTGLPSVSAAVGHIGGSFLGKVFDEDMINKYADKVKNFISPNEDDVGIPESIVPMEKKVTPKKSGADIQSFERALDGVTLDLNTDINSNPIMDDVGYVAPPVKAKPVKVADSVTPSVEEKGVNSVFPVDMNPDKGTSITTSIDTPAEISAQQKNSSDELINVSELILGEIKELNRKTRSVEKVSNEDSVSAALEKSTGSNTIVGGVGKTSKKGAGVAEALKKSTNKASYSKPPIATTVPVTAPVGAATGVAGATGVTGAATGGIMAGIGSTLLAGAGLVAAGVTGVAAGAGLVNPLIDKGLSAASGKETSLGGAIYDLLNDDPTMTKAADKISPVTSQGATNVQSLSTKDAKLSTASNAPIVISTGGGNNSPAPASSGLQTSASSTPSIRNQESTFERVQMQDYWPRAA